MTERSLQAGDIVLFADKPGERPVAGVVASIDVKGGKQLACVRLFDASLSCHRFELTDPRLTLRSPGAQVS